MSLRIEAKGRKQLLLVLVLSRGVDSAINVIEDEGFKIVPSNVKYVLIWMAANLFL